jgi:hypothetical protein
MAKEPKKSPPDEDEAQSKRFLDLANELEAAGDLNPTEGNEAFERLVGKAAPPRPQVRTEREPRS